MWIGVRYARRLLAMFSTFRSAFGVACRIVKLVVTGSTGRALEVQVEGESEVGGMCFNALA